MKKNVVISIIVLVVVVIVIMLTFRDDAGKSGQLDNNSTGLIIGKNAINIEEQAISKNVTVSLVLLEKGGYVAVHDMVAGKPGKILGTSALLPGGKSNSVKFSLTESLQAGQNYVAMLHLDNGDGVFKADTDFPVTNDDLDGSAVMMEFQASVDGGVDSISI